MRLLKTSFHFLRAVLALRSVGVGLGGVHGCADGPEAARYGFDHMPLPAWRLVAAGGTEWVVYSVLYDEAGPERVRVLAREDLRADRLEAGFWLTVSAWCDFCEGKAYLPPQDL